MSEENRFNKGVAKYKKDAILSFYENNVAYEKVKRIADRFAIDGISDVVLGISGGIDSAVVFALLNRVKELYIPNLKIHGYCITFDVYGEVFEPHYIDLLNVAFCKKDVTITTVDCSNTLYTMFSELKLPVSDKNLLAQSSYALRYQMLFTYAQMHRGVTVGTTNLDEFDYVGWFGKHSDMVVDFQVITDWRKMLVVEAAKILGVPDDIISRKPTGDLINGSTDEENFGVTYDELAYMKIAHQTHSDSFLNQKYKKVNELHNKNLHKYQGQNFNPIFIY